MCLDRCIGKTFVSVQNRIQKPLSAIFPLTKTLKHFIFFFCIRFNGYDQRLDRELEAVVMVMEAFEGFENRVRYDIIGHSGESKNILFVNEKSPPTDSKMRLETIKVCRNCFSLFFSYVWSPLN